MAKYRLLVTDITEYGSLRCVAGWDLEREKMIRPEPAPGDFWSGTAVGPTGQFRRGAIVDFEAHSPNPTTDYPHRTEDRVVAGQVNYVRTLSPADRQMILAQMVSPDLQNLFSGKLQAEGFAGFVALGTRCRSLGAIEIEPSAVSVYEDLGWGKKRLRIRLPIQNRIVAPSITSALVRRIYREAGLDALRAQLSSAKCLHLRIGLARAFSSKPDRCYLQVNDIYTVG
jgi:hypothetical protein